MWDLILPCVSVRDSIFHTTYAGLLVPNIHHTGTTDSRPKGGTHRLLQRIKIYQGGTHRLLQRIKGYQGGTHRLLQRIKRFQGGTHRLLQRIKGYQEGSHYQMISFATTDSYYVKKHTLTPTKDQKISRGKHWLLQKHRYQRDTHQLQSMEISKAHTDPNSLKLISRWYTPCSFTTKTEITERLEGKTEISRRNTPDPTETQRYQGGTGTHLLLERNTNWDIKEIHTHSYRHWYFEEAHTERNTDMSKRVKHQLL